jgi:hypothetical protein
MTTMASAAMRDRLARFFAGEGLRAVLGAP